MGNGTYFGVIKMYRSLILSLFRIYSFKFLSVLLKAKMAIRNISRYFVQTLEFCLLSNNIMDYYYVAQGKTTIPNVDDAEEFTLTNVSG